MSDATEVPPLTFTYTNWRGETSTRTVRPIGISYASPEWHPEPDWLLHAYDDEKKAGRVFAFSGFAAPQPAASDAKTKVVPLEPTEAMMEAFCEAHRREWGAVASSGYRPGPGDLAQPCYAAMLAAAPQPAASDVPHDVVRALEAEIDRLTDEVDDLRQEPWPKWAEFILSRMREYGCVDRFDDEIDLPQVFDEWVDGFEQEVLRKAAPAPSTSTEEALRAENARLRGVLEAVRRGVEVAQLGLARDGVQHAKLKRTEAAIKTALSESR